MGLLLHGVELWHCQILEGPVETCGRRHAVSEIALNVVLRRLEDPSAFVSSRGVLANGEVEHWNSEVLLLD